MTPGAHVPLSGTVRLPLSTQWQLVTLVKALHATQPASSRWPVPCARSYEGHQWEVVLPRTPGTPLVSVSSCDASTCDIVIPDDDPSYLYYTQAVDLGDEYGALSSTEWHERTAAQLLIQATFGPTVATIANLSQQMVDDAAASFVAGVRPPPAPPAIERWVDEQLALPPTLHRAYLRRRYNPRQSFLSDLGRPRGACEPGARWSRLVLRADDISSSVQVRNVTTTGSEHVLALYVDGVLRSEVYASELRLYGLVSSCGAICSAGTLLLESTYTICQVEEWRLGRVVIGTSCIFNGAIDEVELFNALITFDQLSPPDANAMGEPMARWTVSGDAQATLRRPSPATPWNEGVLLLEALGAPCPLTAVQSMSTDTTLVHGGLWYRYDPRLVALDNSYNAPANSMIHAVGAGHGAPANFICPVVPKTAMNEHTCVLTHGCSPYVYSGPPLQLNASTLRAMYLGGRTIAFALDNLPPTIPGQSFRPCTRKSRWRPLGGACTLHGGESAAMTNGTRTALAAALRTSADTNAHTRDIDGVDSSDSSGCSTPPDGSQLDVDGECWQHVNELHLNVYDFTTFATGMEHPGNDGTRGFFPLQQRARAGVTTLVLPASHVADNRVRTGHILNSDGLQGTVYIGRLGEWVEFAALPRTVRTPGLAEVMGVGIAEPTGEPAVEQCGSPGEVSNDAALGMRFYVTNERVKASIFTVEQEIPLNGQRSNSNTPQIIHTEIALHQPDQLRQRVAWALSQVLVAAGDGAKLTWDSREMFTTFYDIFVRHAFGSYRDVLREVSFSPVMAFWLTYMDNKAWAASYPGTVPDENYAREIMQLFSIGLWELNDDGTQVADANGQPVPTYVNADIVEQARCWTGFTQRAPRGNVEIRRHPWTMNQYDPMHIRQEWRDTFPKMDLYRGHLGDAYPLCIDQGARAFLRVGAKYRYLGRDRRTPDLSFGFDWTTRPNANADNAPPFAPIAGASALFEALCNAAALTTAPCRFAPTIVLSSQLPCHGVECTIDTVRLVQINASGALYYYEYEPPPCVSLAFVGDGRFVDNLHGTELRDRLCMEPRATAASAGCCTPRSHACYEVACGYIEERLSFASALQRCDAWYGQLASPPPPHPSPPEPSPPPPSANAAPPAPPTAPGSWFLYPFGYGSSEGACPSGSVSASEADCMDAAAIALTSGAEPHFDAPERASLSTITKSTRPAGCTVDLANARVVYNRHATGTGVSQYKLVCSAAAGATPAAANLSAVGGTGRLCAHKRDRCQNEPAAGRGCHSNLISPTLYGTYLWSEERCHVQVQVHLDGRVSRVDVGGGGTDPAASRLQPNSENWFRVRWANGSHPSAATGCAANACTVHARAAGDTCLCDVSVSTHTVFTDALALPSAAQVEAALAIGALPPSHFDAGTYAECTTAACVAAAPEVRVFTRGGAATPAMDADAIFAIVVNASGANATSHVTRYLANKASTVTISHDGALAGFSFRNPPQFMTLYDATQRDALYETEALLDHLFRHRNVGPFIAYRLAQHLVTSNPSPRYLATATAAFRTGAYGGTNFSGMYGDVGALVAALVLDREARSLVLTHDASHGHLREPLSRLYHLLRSLEARTSGGRLLELSRDMQTIIGQSPYRSPSVFSFYRPEYAPSGAVQAAGLVAPEAQLGVLPLVIGWLDGVHAMIFDGFSGCGSTFFTASCNGNLQAYPASWNLDGFAATSDGYLGWQPTNASSAAAIVDELSLLLSARRLDHHTRAVIVDEVEHARARSRCDVDRTAALCGRLTPGQQLLAGEFIVNALNETLCFTYDGVARHIGADGVEVFSTASWTRERGERFTYDADGVTYVRAFLSAQFFWKSSWYCVGSLRAFHSFLAGPCEQQDAAAHERFMLYMLRTDTAITTLVQCIAASTCGLPAPAPPSADYTVVRARTNAAHAVRVAQSLLAATAAFSTTGAPMTREVSEMSEATRVSGTSHGQQLRPYKALVVFFMRGGADTFNVLVPTGGCDGRQLQQQYTDTRGAMALSSTRPITVPAGTQPCTQFGIHPELSALQTFFNDADLAFVANAGALIAPTSKAAYLEDRAELVPQLFAHNWQQDYAESLHPQEVFADGIVGRVMRELAAQQVADNETPFNTGMYAITNNKYIFRGMGREPVMLSASDGMLTYEGSANALKARNALERNRTLSAIQRIVRREAGSLYAEAHHGILHQSLADSERIAGLLADVGLHQDWNAAINGASTPPNSATIVEQLEQVSRVIARRSILRAERDVFMVELGGFDTHADLLEMQKDKFKGMNVAFQTFANELKALGVWQQVTLVGISEFGRTMTTNGRGSDHAWGGNYFAFGGDVRGGHIHGTFPELRVDGPDSISSTGQILPTTPWEGLWRPLAQWLGLRDERMPAAMPNLDRFPAAQLLNRSIFFDSTD